MTAQIMPPQGEQPRYRRPSKVPHLTVAERAQRGRAARKEVPRSSHAMFEPGPGRLDPISLLERQAATRVPELVPIRYGRMLVSPFAFFRGAALIMAADLAGTPTSGLRAQVCGDAHLSNFGVFATPERRMTFDINDFDETLPGPWEWDVKRLAASFAIAAREKGFSAADQAQTVRTTVGAYREGMAEFAAARNLDVWYSHLDAESILRDIRDRADKTAVKRVESNLAKARTRDSMQAFSKLTQQTPDGPRFVSQPPLIVPITQLLPDVQADELLARLRTLIRSYRRTLTSDRRHLLEEFRMVDMARKVVGVGSVGTRAWVALFLGRDDEDPLILQMKEAQPSVLEEFVGRSEYTSSAQRVVAGQRLMQASSDIFLGWQKVTGIDGKDRDFYVRQLRDWKASADIETLRPRGLAIYGQLCGWTLARAHARSGDRVAIASYLGAGDVFDRAVVEFAEAYADQNEKDYAALQEAVADGRLTAITGK
jgi:uncharacterized protein (DUF2252 family)